MRIDKYLTALATIVVLASAHAQTADQPIQFKVVYGEKTTIFTISKAKSGALIDFSNNMGANSKKQISDADYAFLKKKVLGFTGPTNSREFCPRNHIVVTANNRELIGCLGARNKLAQDIQETANLVSVLF